jgi:hypothetical protein
VTFEIGERAKRAALSNDEDATGRRFALPVQRLHQRHGSKLLVRFQVAHHAQRHHLGHTFFDVSQEIVRRLGEPELNEEWSLGGEVIQQGLVPLVGHPRIVPSHHAESDDDPCISSVRSAVGRPGGGPRRPGILAGLPTGEPHESRHGRQGPAQPVAARPHLPSREERPPIADTVSCRCSKHDRG